MFKRNRLTLAMTGGLLGAAMLSTALWPAMAETPASVNPPTTAATAVILPAAPPVVAAGSLPELTTLIKQNSASVVYISVEGKKGGKYSGLPDDLELPPELERFFRGLPHGDDGSRPMRAAGSGFIISADGYIVTNAHVVEDAKKVTVGLSDKRELQAEIVGTDKLSDLALLKIKADNLPVVQLGNSDALEVGQWVVAIGAPFGLDHTATQGIVSALSRSLPDGTYVPFIQTDVAVNPGNSGGPLFGLNGQVVGVNSQIYSRSGGYMGISFAIPVNVVKKVVDDLKSKGEVSRGWLGVAIQDMDQKLASSFNLTQPNGALVNSVETDSPADKAGIQAGDVITGFGAGEVTSASDLPLLVGNTPVGTAVPVRILRVGEEKTLEVTVDALTEKDGKGGKRVASVNAGKATLGIIITDLSVQQRKENNLKDEGVLIQEVVSGSVAENAGLEQGDIIISINNSPVHSVNELRSAVAAAPQGKPLALLVIQDGQTRFLAISKP